MLNWRITNQRRFRLGKNDCDYKFGKVIYYEKVDDVSFTAKM